MTGYHSQKYLKDLELIRQMQPNDQLKKELT